MGSPESGGKRRRYGSERPERRQGCMGANKEGEQRLYGRKTIREEILNGRRDPWRRKHSRGTGTMKR